MQEQKRNGLLELEKLQEMVEAWKESYLRSAEQSGGGGFLSEDFREEIEKQVLPYLRRLFETQHIDKSQMQEFLRFCAKQSEDLNNRMQQEA